MRNSSYKEKKYRKSIQWVMTLFLPVVIIGGYFYPAIGFTIVGMIVFFMTLASKRGRLYCGWLCPMGSFHERFLSKISRHNVVPSFFRSTYFRVFVFAAMMGFMTYRLSLAQGDAQAIGGVFRMMWIVSIALAIGMGLYYKARTWCVICPMGSLQGAMSLNTFRLHVSDECVGCRTCQRLCPISTYPGNFYDAVSAKVPSIDCLRCYNCVENCPKGALDFR